MRRSIFGTSIAIAPMAVTALIAWTMAAPQTARADASPKQRILVLPLPPTNAVQPDAARAFDARLLVALEETGRAVTITPAEEPECTSMDCLAALGTASDATHVLTLSLLREQDGLTLFGTLIDSSTATTSRRAELTGLSAADLAKNAPADVARRIVGTPAGPIVVGVALPSSGDARLAATAWTDKLAALRTFKVVTLDGADRSTVTHKAELSIAEFDIVKRRHRVHRYLDGVLVGTATITDLSDGRVLFTKTVKVTVSRRFRYSSRAEVSALLIEKAVQDWMAAFHSENVESHLQGGKKR
jgi:hypothetical protein